MNQIATPIREIRPKASSATIQFRATNRQKRSSPGIGITAIRSDQSIMGAGYGAKREDCKWGESRRMSSACRAGGRGRFLPSKYRLAFPVRHLCNVGLCVTAGVSAFCQGAGHGHGLPLVLTLEVGHVPPPAAPGPSENPSPPPTCREDRELPTPCPRRLHRPLPCHQTGLCSASFIERIDQTGRIIQFPLSSTLP